jgi:DoxX
MRASRSCSIPASSPKMRRPPSARSSRPSPTVAGGFLLRTFAEPIPEVAGVGVALFEIVVGLLALFGLLTRAAAAAGLGLSLLLFLTASWKTRPFFLGPDLVFVFAWLPPDHATRARAAVAS